MIFVGYPSIGYYLLDPEANRVTNSCNVKFNGVKERIAISDINQENLPVNANS